ncbi:MAG TPA: DUF2971 domain-containing protein [Pyrinomonadaceae bacterium]|jgi:hypothetical protein|nr:DUF2971 domain-containing protein [Pyrinomonadaceae bacterium]
MLVYKYLHPHRIEVLQRGLIRFTQPAALNDPFEIMPNLHKIRQYYADQTKNLTRGMDPFSIVLADFTTQINISKTFGRWQADNASELAFLSLSKNRNNLLMWSHYCNSHRGFVVGFDSSHPFFSALQAEKKSILREVRYRSDRPIAPTPGGQWPDWTDFVMVKSAHWSYEEELRLIANPSGADEAELGPDGHAIYLFKFAAESVREVILGHRILKKDHDEIRRIVDDKYEDVKMFKTALSETKYDMNVFPLSS